MIIIRDLIKDLEELEKKGYKEVYVTLSDGYDSHDASVAFNEGVLTDGTKVADMDVFTMVGREKW